MTADVGTANSMVRVFDSDCVTRAVGNGQLAIDFSCVVDVDVVDSALFDVR
jgi:hypothetical protein